MRHWYRDIAYSNEKDELETLGQQKQLGVKEHIRFLDFSSSSRMCKINHEGASQSRGREDSPRKEVQGRPSAQYLNHLAQDGSDVGRTLLSYMFRASALPVLGMLYLNAGD